MTLILAISYLFSETANVTVYNRHVDNYSSFSTVVN